MENKIVQSRLNDTNSKIYTPIHESWIKEKAEEESDDYNSKNTQTTKISRMDFDEIIEKQNH